MSDQSDVQAIVQQTIHEVTISSRVKPNPKQWLAKEIQDAKDWGTKEIVRRHQARVDQMAKEERRARKEGGRMRTATGMMVSGVSAATNTSTFGFAPELAGGFAALKGPFTGEDPEELGQAEVERLRAAQGARREVDPITSLLGSVGGFFTGPAGLTTTGASKVILGRGGPLTNLTRPVVTSPTAGRGLKTAAQTLENVAGGSAAVTAYELIRNRAGEEEEHGVAARLRSAREVINSPLFLGLSAVAGAITGPQRITQSRAATMTVAELKRLGIPEKMIPPSVMREGTAFGESLTAAQDKIVGRGGLRALQKYGKVLGDNIQTSVEGLLGGAKRNVKEAGKAVRDLLVTFPKGKRTIDPKSTEGRGRIDRARREIYAQAVKEQGQKAVTYDELKALRTIFAEVKAKLRLDRKEVGKDLEAVYRKFDIASRVALEEGIPVTMRALNNFRKEINVYGSVGQGITSRTSREAANNKVAVDFLRAGVNTVLTARAPKIARANEIHGEYQRILDHFGAASKVVEATRSDFTTLSQEIFKGGNVANRWRLLTEGDKRLGTSPLLNQQEIQTLRGHYLAEFFDDLAIAGFKGAKGMTAAIDKAWKSGKYNEEVFDTVLGDGGVIRRAIRAELVISDKFQTLIQAGAKGPNLPQIDQSASQTAAFVVLGSLILRRPGLGIPLVLGEMGLSKFAHSSLQGRAAQRLNSLTKEGFQPSTGILPQTQAAISQTQQNPLLQGFNPSLTDVVTGGGQ